MDIKFKINMLFLGVLLTGCGQNALLESTEISTKEQTLLNPDLNPELAENMRDRLEKYPNPIWSATQATENFLRLIDSLHHSDDFTLEHIKKTIGINMTATKEEPLNGAWALITSNYWGWIYKLYNGVLIFNFNSGHSPKPYSHSNPPPMTEVCEIDLNQITQFLLQKGFKETGREHWEATLPLIWYQRGNIQVEIAYAGESNELGNERVTHDCAEIIKVKYIPI